MGEQPVLKKNPSSAGSGLIALCNTFSRFGRRKTTMDSERGDGVFRYNESDRGDDIPTFILVWSKQNVRISLSHQRTDDENVA